MALTLTITVENEEYFADLVAQKVAALIGSTPRAELSAESVEEVAPDSEPETVESETVESETVEPETVESPTTTDYDSLTDKELFEKGCKVLAEHMTKYDHEETLALLGGQKFSALDRSAKIAFIVAANEAINV